MNARRGGPERSRIHGWEDATRDVEHPFMESNHNIAPLHLHGRALHVALAIAALALLVLILI